MAFPLSTPLAPSIGGMSTSFALDIERLWPIQSYGYVISPTTRLYGAVELGLPLSRIIENGAPVLRGYSTYRVAYRLYTPPSVGAHPYYIMMDQWRRRQRRWWSILGSLLPVFYRDGFLKITYTWCELLNRIVITQIGGLIIMLISCLVLLE